MSLPAEFWQKLPQRGDKELYDILNHAEDYLPEALDAVKAELSGRILPLEVAIQLEAQATAQRGTEDAKASLSLGWPTRIRQAAVWIVTDDASYSDLGILISRRPDSPFPTRIIRENETAMRLCGQAGIDVPRKRIWRDKQKILRGLEAGHLKTWLEEKE